VNENIKIELKQSTVENLQLFSEITGKDINTMLEEALEEYFAAIQKKMLEKNIEDENMLTNLDYDEFWDGVDV
jgi:hypothetical protein